MSVCSVSATGEFTCGTGGWQGPKPGDPDMYNIQLNAAGTYGGVEITWTWPTVNSGAVSYTILWRSITDDFATAGQLAIAQGNYYLDRVDVEINQGTVYYYWVQMVSIYDTVGDPIGPAEAVAMPLIGQMLDILTGKINAQQLSTALKTEVDQITVNKLGITAEELARDQNDDALAVRISELSAKSDDAMALLQEEVRLRVDADGAFVQVVETMYAEFGESSAALQNQVTLIATEQEAMSSTLTTVNAQVNGDSASGQVGLVAEVNTLDGKVTSIGARYTAVVDVNGLVGGFGIYNDGTTVEAGFNVDRFWIGSSDTNKRKPFIVDNNVVYIDEAAINSLVFTKIRSEDGSFAFVDGKLQAEFIAVDQIIVNNIQSDNYVPNTSGWALDPSGIFQFNGVAGGGRLSMTQTLIRVYDGNGIMRVRLGVW